MKSRHKITLLLPGYNEQANVAATVEKSRAALSRLCDDFEIIIIDDGSIDEMGALADSLARADSRVRVIHNTVNLGVGISLLIGMKAATGDWVAHNAMDYPFHIEDLAAMLPLFETSDVVAVVRSDRSAHSPYRKFTSLVNFWLIRLLFGPGLADMNFVQIYKKEVLRAVKVKAKSPAFVTPELLIRAKRQGFKVSEAQAQFHRRIKGQASYGRPRDILWTLADIFSFWLEGSGGNPPGA